MKSEQVLEVLKFIRGSYSRFEINEEMPRVWLEFLKDESFDMVMNRIKKHVKSSEFPPTIHNLISHVDKDLEARHIEIALNKWIAEGKDPDDFNYKSASNY